MDSLHRSKHLWCLKRCKEASIDRSKTFFILPSISAQLLVCPKRAKLPSYLAFYLLLMLVCPFGAKELASNCALRRDRCLLI
jgi:hypothetical protein